MICLGCTRCLALTIKHLEVVPGARFAPRVTWSLTYRSLPDGEYEPRGKVKNTDTPVEVSVGLPSLRAG
jgi:hypothetical protein